MMPLLVNILAWNVVISAILAVLLWLAGWTRLLRERPSLRHSLWLLVLFKLLTPPMLPVPVLPRLTAANHVAIRGTVETTSLAPTIVVDSVLEERRIHDDGNAIWLGLDRVWILLLVSLVVTIVIVIRACIPMRGLQVLLQRADCENPMVNEIGRREATKLGVAVSPTVCIVNARIAPLLWVFRGCPWIVLPKFIVDEFNEQQIACVVRHELAHYVRRDHWSNLIAFFSAALFWWNPIAFWAHRELKISQEASCDALAMQGETEIRRLYADTLLQVIDLIDRERWMLPSLASGFGETLSIQRRFEMIANEKVAPRLSRKLQVVLGCIAVMICCYPVVAKTPAVDDQSAGHSSNMTATDDDNVTKKPSADADPTVSQENKNKHALKLQFHWVPRPEADITIFAAEDDGEDCIIEIAIECFQLSQMPQLLTSLTSSQKLAIHQVRILPADDVSVFAAQRSPITLKSKTLPRKSVAGVLDDLHKRLRMNSITVMWPLSKLPKNQFLELLYGDAAMRANRASSTLDRELAGAVTSALPEAIDEDGWVVELQGYHYYR